MAEGGAGQAPDVVVRQVEGLQLGQPLQRVGLQLQRHGAGPLAVVALHRQLPQVLQPDEGGGRQQLELAELEAEPLQLRQRAEVVGAQQRLVQVDVRAVQGQRGSAVNLQILGVLKRHH